MTSAAGARLHRVRREARAEVVLVQADAEITSWPLWVDGEVDLSVVDRLARLQLAARSSGCSIHLRHTCPHLLALLDLVGLADLLVLDASRGPASVPRAGGRRVRSRPGR